MGEGDEDGEGEGKEGEVDDKGGAGVEADQLVESVRDFRNDCTQMASAGVSLGEKSELHPQIFQSEQLHRR